MTGSGSPSADITPEIAQAIFMWIRQYANGGLVQFRDFYLEADAHGTIGGALIELEDRYSLGQGELTEEYEMRLGSLAERRRRQADQELDFNAPMRDHDELVRDVPDSSKAAAFLYCLPKPELLTALELYAASRPPIHRRSGHRDLFSYLEHVFRARGLPYTASRGDGIAWVGEPAVRELAIKPGLTALADSRLSQAREEFDKARRHLRRGESKDAGRAAGDAVETTMAVLLGELGHPQPQSKHGTDLVQANKLWDQLKNTSVAALNEDRDKELIYAPMKVRNACGHGGGANPKPPDPAYVGAGVAAAAVAITYLASKLP